MARAPLIAVGLASCCAVLACRSDAGPTSATPTADTVPAGLDQNSITAPTSTAPPVATDLNRPSTGPTVRLQGRFDTPDANNNAMFAWPASTMITRVLGTGLTIKLSDVGSFSYDGNTVHNYYNVYVDSVLHGTFAVNGNDNTYVVAEGLPNGDHIVRVVKRTEPQMGTATFGGFAALGNGQLLPASPAAERQIEFIGDSITAGYGADGNVASADPNSANYCPFSAAIENADATYASMTSVNLGAEYIAVAFSGKGMVQNNDCFGDPTNTLPVLYNTIVPLHDPNNWEFSSWTPQVVVINLGTNDYNSAGNGCTAPTDANFIAGWVSFVKTVRTNYPKATIFCTIGPTLGPPLSTTAQNNILSAVSQLNDPNVVYVALAVTTGDVGYGCAGHPNKATYEIMTTTMTAAIKQKMGW